VAERRNRLLPGDSSQFLELLGRLPIQVHQQAVERQMGTLLQQARAHGLSSYDASYLDLAMRKGLPLATADRGLIRAAETCRVPLFSSGP